MAVSLAARGARFAVSRRTFTQFFWAWPQENSHLHHLIFSSRSHNLLLHAAEAGGTKKKGAPAPSTPQPAKKPATSPSTPPAAPNFAAAAAEATLPQGARTPSAADAPLPAAEASPNATDAPSRSVQPNRGAVTGGATFRLFRVRGLFDAPDEVSLVLDVVAIVVDQEEGACRAAHTTARAAHMRRTRPIPASPARGNEIETVAACVSAASRALTKNCGGALQASVAAATARH